MKSAPIGHSESVLRNTRASARENHHDCDAHFRWLRRYDGDQQRHGRGRAPGLNSTEGAGFIGIAVALMGRSHPLGVFYAALLFGFLYQGGRRLGALDDHPRELIVVIQALVILFTGALDNMVRMPLEKIFLAMRRTTGECIMDF